jgi:hypothetical protein
MVGYYQIPYRLFSFSFLNHLSIISQIPLFYRSFLHLQFYFAFNKILLNRPNFFSYRTFDSYQIFFLTLNSLATCYFFSLLPRSFFSFTKFLHWLILSINSFSFAQKISTKHQLLLLTISYYYQAFFIHELNYYYF